MSLVASTLLTLFVYAAEHLLMTRVYGRRSALQRLVRPSASAKTDLPFVLLYEVGFQWLGHLPKLVCGPGLLYLGLGFLFAHSQFTGLAGGRLSDNPWLLGILMLLALDLPLYVTHVAMHRIPALWRFHAVHHAATEMTIANGSRVALAEYFLGEAAILVFVTFIFGVVRPEVILPLLIIRNAIDMIQHSDLPWHFGPVGFIIASPRFHRLHHSSEDADRDANYANIFAAWDWLFGTVAPRFRAAPNVADGCRLGLSAYPAGDRYDPVLAPLIATFPGDAMILWRKLRVGRPAS